MVVPIIHLTFEHFYELLVHITFTFLQGSDQYFSSFGYGYVTVA